MLPHHGVEFLAAAPNATVTRLSLPAHFTAIAVSVAVVALVLALLLKWKPLAKIGFLIPWLILIAGIGAAGLFLTGWANVIAGWSTAAVPVAGGLVVKGAAVALAYIVCYDLWPKHPSNGMTEVSAFLLPAFGPEIGGAVGSGLATGLGWVESVGSFAISGLFGV